VNLIHRWYCRSDRWAGIARQKRVPWVLGEADLDDDVLEIGPGPGITTEIIHRQAPRMTLLEIDPWSVDALRSKFGADPGIEIVQGDATAMPLEAGRFSAAICLTMFHHVPSPAQQDALLAETARVLPPGGVFLGSDSTTRFRFRVYHLGDTCVPVDPDRFGERLVRAGFIDPRISQATGSFRFRAVRRQGDGKIGA
jgi:ubiquinone/menaquinone biosynthesis C-methylase UbiE